MLPEPISRKDRQVLADDALQVNEERFRLLVERNLAGIVLCELLYDVDGNPVDHRLIMANQACQAQTGLRVEDQIGRRSEELAFSWPEAWKSELYQVALTGEPLNYERYNESLGRWYEVSAFSPMKGQFALLFLDISQRKAAEAATRESERFLKQAQKAGRIGTYDWRIQEDRWFGSDQLDELFGIDAAYPRTLEGWVAIVAPAWRERMAAYVRHIIAEDLPFDLDYQILRPRDGQLRWVHGQGELERDDQGQPLRLIGVIQDISEKKQAQAEREQLEAEIMHAQKLESLGSLAGGVAHDMNNVLGAIQAVTETLQLAYPDETRLQAALGTIEKASQRGRDLVKGLLDFARKDLREAASLDLNDLVRQEAALLERTLLQKVQLALDLESPLPAILGERSALESALMNLCVNAVDAMPGGGLLTLRTRALSGPRQEPLVELQVEDTGEGMSQAVLRRAVEPFFTTKPFGKGTGLGLARVNSLMKTHGGTLDLRSQEGQGTCVSLRFPAIAGLSDPPVPPEAATSAGRPFSILLVDDDELIRATAPGLLALLGHSTRTVSSGQEALAFLHDHAQVDLVILDVNMPGMDGLATLAYLRAFWPSLPVLLATGYVDAKVEAALHADRNLRVIQKPYALAQIRTRILETALSRGEPGQDCPPAS